MTVEERVVQRLVEEMNATILASVKPFTQKRMVDLGRARLAADVYVNTPVRVPLAVVMEAPEHEDQDPRQSPSTREVRRLLIKSDAEAAWLYAVGKPCDPRPTVNDMSAYRGEFLRALDAADVRYVLLVGKFPSLAWRTDLGVTELEGRCGVMLGRWIVMAVREWAAVVRIDHGKGHESEQWRKKVLEFVETAENDLGVSALGFGCMKKGCVEPMYAYDLDGLPWCRNHHAIGMAGANATRRRWRVEDDGQQSLIA